MSTVPHNALDAADAQSAAGILRLQDLNLDVAIRHFEVAADGLGARRPLSAELTNMVYQLAALTTELFPGNLSIETGIDPENRDDVCLLFQVDAGGNVDEILALHDQWHRRLLSVAPQWPGLFRLSIDAR